MSSRLIRRLALGLPLACLLLCGAGAAAAQSLAEQLEQLGARHGFEVTGLEKIEEEVPVAATGGIYDQLRELLVDYNHIVLRASRGGVKRVIVLGRKLPAPEMPPESEKTEGGADSEIVIKTQRQGSHHLVPVTLIGNGKQRLDLVVMIDTGASFVVLPLSQSAALGMEVEGLQDREVQTVNGKHTAKVAVLQSLQLGTETLNDVEVAFIDDKLLGGPALLGMNVLGRYRMTLDDESGILTLAPGG